MEKSQQVYDMAQALRIQLRYVCAGCWGELSIFPLPGSPDNKVTCLICGDDRGVVTRAYAERRQAESLAELREARQNLRGLIPAPESTQKSPEQLVKELGF
jgi:hypothetical protein